MSAELLETAARVLGPIADEVVFLGGATVHLWLTEPAAPPVRATEDVDVICEVATKAEYYRLGDRLRERGLREVRDEPVICRWRNAELILDVMPANREILGFSNPWYETAIATAEKRALPSGAEIRVTSPTVMVATKLAAWNGRGANDPLRSLDVHDIVVLVDGRPELESEYVSETAELRSYVFLELGHLAGHPQFSYAVDSATAAYGAVARRRADLVQDRIAALVASLKPS